VLVHTLLQSSPYGIVDRVEVGTVRRPKLRLNESKVFDED
jgi:hypothetical protein